MEIRLEEEEIKKILLQHIEQNINRALANDKIRIFNHYPNQYGAGGEIIAIVDLD